MPVKSLRRNTNVPARQAAKGKPPKERGCEVARWF
jgi:hypothetical protein